MIKVILTEQYRGRTITIEAVKDSETKNPISSAYVNMQWMKEKIDDPGKKPVKQTVMDDPELEDCSSEEWNKNLDELR